MNQCNELSLSDEQRDECLTRLNEDGFSILPVRLPDDLLAVISSRIVNEVRGVNRVVYDISSKPPSTIEWE